jgi:nondiscriminating glutamyl-tRNA synthetase
VIDDALMKMSHVFRAEEHLSNTLRQLMLYEAFSYPLPEFGHLSIILGADRQKLSKRHGATSVGEYKEKGYLPEAINNFMALLGWSSPNAQEILSIEEMIEQFTVERLNSAAAVFDEVKLKWVNSQHLRALDHAELWRRLLPFLTRAGLKMPKDKAWQDQALTIFKTSMETLLDGVELFRPLSLAPLEISADAKEALSWPSTKSVVEKWKELVVAHATEFINEEEFNNYQNKVKADCNVKGKELFMPIRVAIIGKPHGAELKILVPLLKKSTLIERADQVLKGIS